MDKSDGIRFEQPQAGPKGVGQDARNLSDEGIPR